MAMTPDKIELLRRIADNPKTLNDVRQAINTALDTIEKYEYLKRSIETVK
jgi:hypothetical protein